MGESATDPGKVAWPALLTMMSIVRPGNSATVALTMSSPKVRELALP
jgi:hypothetical protein